MPTYQGPIPTHMQVSGRDVSDQPILSVLVKRTYTVDSAGNCTPAEEQTPLNLDAVMADKHGRVLKADRDVYPFKPLTDLVITGHAYPTLGPASGEVAVRCAGVFKKIKVLGDRRVSLSASGAPVFESPAPFEKIPLCYSRAYGGRDAYAESLVGNINEALAVPAQLSPADVQDLSPFTYRRNFIGRGFVIQVSKDSITDLLLPNFEYEDDLLTPARLAAGHEDRWAFMPMPAGVSWFHPAWYPRNAWLGMSPFAAELPAIIPEEQRGWAPPKSLDLDGEDAPHLRMANGSSPGLALPLLSGGEHVELAGVFADREKFLIRLPREIPRMQTDGRKGTFKETQTVLHTVHIEPDDHRVTIVYRGCAPALRPYMVKELATMPYKVEWVSREQAVLI